LLVLALVRCQLLIVSVKIVIVDVTEKARAYMVHLVGHFGLRDFCLD
jgi:hypothetical protein